MRKITVIYHCEAGRWWGESPDPGLETFVAGGRDLGETRALANEGLEFHLGEPVLIEEYFAPENTLTLMEVEPGSPLIPSGAAIPSGAITSSGSSGAKVTPLVASEPRLITGEPRLIGC
jgi:hypothetical protein